MSHVNRMQNKRIKGKKKSYSCFALYIDYLKYPNYCSSLKILTIEEEETLTKLLSNEDEELGIVTDYKDKTTVSQTCEDYVNEKY